MIDLNYIIKQYPLELQKVEFYDQMVKEYLHHLMLQDLFTSRYADNLFFLGGTAMRFFHGLRRFSEDLDFDCRDINRDDFIDLTNKTLSHLQSYGIDVYCEDKPRYKNLSAFRRVFVFPGLKYKLGLSQHKEAMFFIKIEAEPHNLSYMKDVKLLNGFGVTVPVSVVPVDLILSTKIAAALTRKKDRDFYDILHLKTLAKPDYTYLAQKQGIETPEDLTSNLLKAAETKRLDQRSMFDCDHMLFFKNDKQKIRNFVLTLKNFGFSTEVKG